MKIVRSRKLGDTIIIVADEAAASRLTNVHHMVYTEKEVSLLKDQPIGVLRQCHQIKSLFGGFVRSVERTRRAESLQQSDRQSGQAPAMKGAPEKNKRLF